VTTGYKAATYSNVLDDMLASGASPGQGGHLEGTPAQVFTAVWRLTNSCYSFVLAEMANILGLEGAKPILKRAIWKLGRYVGTKTRRRFEDQGVALTVENFLRDGLSGMADIQEMQGDFTWKPHYVAYDEYYCPTWDQYARLCPRELAVLTCEDIHVAMAKAFNPDIDQWFSSLLPKGEAKCGFKWEMPFEAAKKAEERAQQYREWATEHGISLQNPDAGASPDAAAVYRNLVGMWVYKYYFPLDELARTLPHDEVESIAARAMRRWGAWRGQMMREDHERRGWALNAENLIKYSDDPAAGDAWIAENVALSAAGHTKDVIKSALSDELDAVGVGKFGVPLFEEALPAQAKAYNPAIELTIPKLMERGDAVSRYIYTMVS
jgi:hypothetical protein